MCADFNNFLRTKGYIDGTSKYLPRLSKWVSDKITFWQTDLGSNLLQNNTKNVNVKRNLAVTSEHEKKSDLNYYNKNSRNFDKDYSNSDDRP